MITKAGNWVQGEMKREIQKNKLLQQIRNKNELIGYYGLTHWPMESQGQYEYFKMMIRETNNIH